MLIQLTLRNTPVNGVEEGNEMRHKILRPSLVDRVGRPIRLTARVMARLCLG